MPTIAAQQILVPKKGYIGDTAELRCSFNNGSNLLKTFTEKGSTELSLVSQDTFTSTDEYTIKNVTLSPAGVDFYQLTVTFIPWKTGSIQLPPLQLEGTDITIDFQPVQIVSLILQRVQMQPPCGIRRHLCFCLAPPTSFTVH